MEHGFYFQRCRTKSSSISNSRSPERKQLKLEDTAGIPTGLCPELSQQIELRKARRAQAQQEKAAAENLAKDAPEKPHI